MWLLAFGLRPHSMGLWLVKMLQTPPTPLHVNRCDTGISLNIHIVCYNIDLQKLNIVLLCYNVHLEKLTSIILNAVMIKSFKAIFGAVWSDLIYNHREELELARPKINGCGGSGNQTYNTPYRASSGSHLYRTYVRDFRPRNPQRHGNSTAGRTEINSFVVLWFVIPDTSRAQQKRKRQSELIAISRYPERFSCILQAVV